MISPAHPTTWRRPSWCRSRRSRPPRTASTRWSASSPTAASSLRPLRRRPAACDAARQRACRSPRERPAAVVWNACQPWRLPCRRHADCDDRRRRHTSRHYDRRHAGGDGANATGPVRRRNCQPSPWWQKGRQKRKVVSSTPSPMTAARKASDPSAAERSAGSRASTEPISACRAVMAMHIVVRLREISKGGIVRGSEDQLQRH